jgi:hypothetical protein
MKRVVLFFLFNLLTALSFAQQAEISGTVKDAVTGETVVGATVVLSDGKSAVTDINGTFLIKADSGQYTITITMMGFETVTQKLKVSNKKINISVSLTTKTLNEVEVVADVAKSRETPIAFSNITAKQIQEELGTRDLPMILNTTPGVYATEQGGGSGDARVTIRGFDQRNVAVMVDGVPVNDMENGQVYWSNWEGLGDAIRMTQVQRGLGASKLAIASVGGTINYITVGIDQKMGGVIRQEVNDFGLYKTAFSFNSGQLKKGWGFSLAGSSKYGNGWADGTFTEAYSYFAKIQYRRNKHLFSLTGSGAPQRHGQRLDRMPIAIYSKKLAEDLGIDAEAVYASSAYTTKTQGERGRTYNANWGYLGTREMNERINYFHKPQINFSHFWSGEKLSVSTILYMSIGTGGGTGFKGSVGRDTLTGLLKFDNAYNANASSSPAIYSPDEHISSTYLRASNNNHKWYGALSSWTYRINENLTALAGIDARYYKGSHYQSVYDLLGGEYAVDVPNPSAGLGNMNQPVGAGNQAHYVRHEGEKISYNNDAEVMWGGLFGQAEYKKKNWTTFFTASLSETAYQRIDYYKRRDLVIDDEIYNQAVGYGDVFYYNGSSHITAYNNAVVTTSGDTVFVDNPGAGPILSIVNPVAYNHNSPEARAATTKRKWFPGYTLKGGANYNFFEHHNAFINLGYLNMAPRMNVVFDNNNKEFLQVDNQKVYAIEAGYGFKSQMFAANVNAYYTLWQNKPPAYTPTIPDLVNGGVLSYNINGLDALHKGVEMDFIYKIMKNLDLEGLASLGDWKTVSAEKVYVTDESGVLRDSVDFSAKNVHVGDAAQTQFAGSLRWEIIKNLYIKPRYTFFAKNYANFDPTTLVDANKDRESWQMPDYGILDIYAGYELKVWKDIKLGFTLSVLNVLDKVYISDAQNGAGFNAETALVYVGMGRRITGSMRIIF